MGIRETLRNIRNYFSRDKTPLKFNDDRGRNAQMGYLQRRTLFDKTLDFIGKTALYIGLTLTAATGIGAVALGVQYIRGAPPFRDVRDTSFEITQNTVTEKPTRPNKPGVNLFVPPFERVVEEDGRPVKISGLIQSVETPEFMYRSRDNLQVKLKTQYNFQVNSPEGAAQVYWDYGGLDKAKETLDTIVENALMYELSKVPARDIASEERIAEKDEQIFVDGKYISAQGGEKINYLIDAENRANEILRKERIGVVVTNFSISNPKYTPTVELAWEAPARAEALVVEERGRAQARIIKAESEAREAAILRDATLDTIGGYFDKMLELANKTGQPQEAGKWAMALHDRDNIQQIANSGARIIYAPGFTGNPPVYMPVNLGTVNPKQVP